MFLHVRVKQVAFTISACIHTRGKTSTSATSTFLPYPTQWLVYTLAVRLPYPPPQLWFWGETRAQCADTGDHSLLFDSCTLCIRQTLLCFLRFLTVQMLHHTGDIRQTLTNSKPANSLRCFLFSKGGSQVPQTKMGPRKEWSRVLKYSRKS